MIKKIQYHILKTIKPISVNFNQGNYKPVHKETIQRNLNIIGKIPSEINGLYIRNGPNSINKINNHWFDGDGMIHSVQLNGKNNTANYQNLFIKTKLLHEKFSPFSLSTLYGLQGLLILILEFIFYRLKNYESIGSTANTSIIFYNNKLLAFNDNDLPYTLKINNNGIIENLNKIVLHPNKLRSISAHPKKDPITNELFFISYNLFQKPHLQIGSLEYNIYNDNNNDSFNINWIENININPVMMHDFAITKNYIILLDFPIVPDLLNMICGKSIIKFNPNKKTRIGILKKKNTQNNILWFNLNKPCASFHIVNSYEEECQDKYYIHLYICQYDHIDIEFNKKYSPQIYKYTLDINNNTFTSSCINQMPLEFPCINHNYIGIKNKYAWLSHVDNYHFDGIAKINLDNNTIDGYINFPDNHFGGETTFVPFNNNNDNNNNYYKEDHGFLLIYIHDETTNKTSLFIYDASTMNNTPLTIININQNIPFGFHGCFIPNNLIIT